MIARGVTSGLRPVYVRLCVQLKTLKNQGASGLSSWNNFFSRARARTCVNLIFNWTYWTYWTQGVIDEVAL